MGRVSAFWNEPIKFAVFDPHIRDAQSSVRFSKIFTLLVKDAKSVRRIYSSEDLLNASNNERLNHAEDKC